MPAVFTYANPATLRRVAQDLIMPPVQSRWLFREVFPIEYNPEVMLRWVMEDNYYGLMAARGVGGDPSSINLVGHQGYEATPGYFGEFGTLDEQQMLARSLAVAGFAQDIQVSVNDLVRRIFDHLDVRYRNRTIQMAGDLLNNGTLSVTLRDGGVVPIGKYIQTIDSPSVPWTDIADATPLAESMSINDRYSRGTSTAFNQTAVQVMNSRTFQLWRRNRNENDIFGEKKNFTNTRFSLNDINEILVGANAPKIVLNDEFYLGNNKEIVMDIPDGVVHIIGARPNGEKPGGLQFTANANNPNNAAGIYAFVEDLTSGVRKTVPPKLIAHMGFNGGTYMSRPKQHIKRVVATAEDMDELLGPVVL